MVISEKCNCCLHEAVCSFKDEYLKACTAIRTATYGKNNGFMAIKDSPITVSIRCPHILTQGALRRDGAEDDR